LCGETPGALPTSEALFKQVHASARSNTKLGKRLFKRRLIAANALQLTEQLLSSQATVLLTWFDECAAFRKAVASEEKVIKLEHKQEALARKALLAEANIEIATVAKDRLEEASAILKRVESTLTKFKDLDAVLNTIVLQAAFSDNAGTAAPVGLDGGDLLVLMTVPDASSLIWPEAIAQSQQGRVSAKPKTKSAIKVEFENYLFCHSVATAREAFAVQPKLQRIRICVLSNDEMPLLDRPILSTLTIDRAAAKGFERACPPKALIGTVVKMLERWAEAQDAQDGEMVLRTLSFWPIEFPQYEMVLAAFDTQLDFLRSAGCWQCSVGSKQTTFRKSSEALDPENIFQSEGQEHEAHADLGIAPEEFHDPQFWILASLLSEKWDDEAIDIAMVRKTADEMTSKLLWH